MSKNPSFARHMSATPRLFTPRTSQHAPLDEFYGGGVTPRYTMTPRDASRSGSSSVATDVALDSPSTSSATSTDRQLIQKLIRRQQQMVNEIQSYRIALADQTHVKAELTEAKKMLADVEKERDELRARVSSLENQRQSSEAAVSLALSGAVKPQMQPGELPSCPEAQGGGLSAEREARLTKELSLLREELHRTANERESLRKLLGTMRQREAARDKRLPAILDSLNHTPAPSKAIGTRQVAATSKETSPDERHVNDEMSDVYSQFLRLCRDFNSASLDTHQSAESAFRVLQETNVALAKLSMKADSIGSVKDSAAYSLVSLRLLVDVLSYAIYATSVIHSYVGQGLCIEAGDTLRDERASAEMSMLVALRQVVKEHGAAFPIR